MKVTKAATDKSNNKSSPFNQYLSSREIGGLKLSESIYPPNTKIPKHSHENPYFCILLQGGYEQVHDSKIQECKPSDTIFHPSQESHSDRFFEKGGRIFKCEIKSEWLSKIQPCVAGAPLRIDSRGGSLSWLAARLYSEFLQSDNASPLIIEELTVEIIGELSSARLRLPDTGEFPRWLRQTRELLHASYRENVTLSSIAEPLGIHPVHFCRSFRRFFGCTVGEYVRRLRIESASRQLANSDDSLAFIALDNGFFDQSHFSKIFKNFTGVSPARYRAIFRFR